VLSISLTCARFDAGGGQLQTGHQLIGGLGQLGLALVVAAVDAAAGRVTSEVRAPRAGRASARGRAAATSHRTC